MARQTAIFATASGDNSCEVSVGSSVGSGVRVGTGVGVEVGTSVGRDVTVGGSDVGVGKIEAIAGVGNIETTVAGGEVKDAGMTLGAHEANMNADKSKLTIRNLHIVWPAFPSQAR